MQKGEDDDNFKFFKTRFSKYPLEYYIKLSLWHQKLKIIHVVL